MLNRVILLYSNVIYVYIYIYTTKCIACSFLARNVRHGGWRQPDERRAVTYTGRATAWPVRGQERKLLLLRCAINEGKPIVQRSAVKEIVASLDRKLATVCGAEDVDRAWVKKGESDAGGRAQVETASYAAEKNCPSTVYQGPHRRVQCRHRLCG